MPVSLDEMMADLSASDRAEVEDGAALIVMQNRTLRDIRKSLGVTQHELARALETSQANVSKLEGRSDLLVSTIARAVAALGGSLQLIVSLPGRPPTTLDVGADRALPAIASRRSPKSSPEAA